MNEIEYFFYEWLTISKNYVIEDIKKLNDAEFHKLKLEYSIFYRNNIKNK